MRCSMYGLFFAIVLACAGPGLGVSYDDDELLPRAHSGSRLESLDTSEGVAALGYVENN